jgi:hypothetical protein
MTAFQILQGGCLVSFAKYIHISQDKTFALWQGKVNHFPSKGFPFQG